MKYYRVKCGEWGYSVNPNFTLLNNELLTRAEVKKLGVPDKILTEVELPKSKTYTMFGVRKEVV